MNCVIVSVYFLCRTTSYVVCSVWVIKISQNMWIWLLTVVMNPLVAFELLFFAVFGQTTYEEMMVRPLPNQQPYRPAWTENLFKVVFGIYMLVSVVVLINLLIAMMSDTYQRIQVRATLAYIQFLIFQSRRIQYEHLSCSFLLYSVKHQQINWKYLITRSEGIIINQNGLKFFSNSYLAYTCWCQSLYLLTCLLLWWQIHIRGFR